MSSRRQSSRGCQGRCSAESFRSGAVLMLRTVMGMLQLGRLNWNSWMEQAKSLLLSLWPFLGCRFTDLPIGRLIDWESPLIGYIDYPNKHKFTIILHTDEWYQQTARFNQAHFAYIIGPRIYLKLMSKGHILSLTVLALLLLSASCALRFHDEDMMREHHKEIPDPNGPEVTVHIIPHSHDDVGWLKTVDDYYYGGDMRTQFAGVQYTIDTVVSELYEHPEYKFSIVEVAFLYRWWNQATDKQRQQMRDIIARGQLHFINGGWCMSDQANMYYQDFIDQMTVGLRWLKDTLNYIPSTAWHIDPFGHHAASASLFSQMGFQSFFFARIDYQDKNRRMDAKEMEMVWNPPQLSGSQSNYIFTHINYFHYSPPPQFCFDPTCRDQPIKDDPTLEDYNVEAKGDQLAQYFRVQAMHYRTTNLMHTLGEDFHYTNSRMWFKNYDKLLNYINKKPELGVKIIYSTPDDYIQAIQKEKATYPSKTDDFFPYADWEHAFWTGYFTSRVALKGFVRDFGRYIQAARKHISELKISNASSVVKSGAKQIQSTIFGMEMAMGILQHHDAVAGTAKQKVTNDYVATSLHSIDSFNKFYRQVKAEEINTEVGESIAADDISINLFWNETGSVTGLSTRLNAGKTVLVSLYNPGAKGSYPIRLKVPAKQLNIVSQSNQSIVGDVICNNLKDKTDCELLFNLDFEQSSNSYVKLVPTSGSAKLVAVQELTISEQIHEFALGNDKLRITHGNQSFDLTLNGVTEGFKIFYNYYEGWDKGGQHSGAYIFRPLSDTPKEYSPIKKIYYADGSTTAMVLLEGDRVLSKVYFSRTVNYVRNYGFMIESFVDSISIADNIGKEVTLNIQTKYKNLRTFYTDSMGLEEQKRVLNYRPSWNYTVFQPTAGNYYPVNSFIRAQDTTTNRSITVVNDRSQGGTVMREGEIEIMIHRRLLLDDSRGVGEPLNQTDSDRQGLRQSVRHYVVFEGDYRTVQKRNDQRILPFFASSSSNTFTKANIRKAPISVPESVKLYLRPFEDGSYLLRFHNTNPASKASFAFADNWTMSEVTLAANQLAADWKKKQYIWNVAGQQKESRNLMERVVEYLSDIGESVNHLRQANQINLLPFQLKAFLIK